MKNVMTVCVLIGSLIPAHAMAHGTGATHLHAEHSAAWLLGAGLIALASGLALARARAERRR